MRPTVTELPWCGRGALTPRLGRNDAGETPIFSAEARRIWWNPSSGRVVECPPGKPVRRTGSTCFTSSLRPGGIFAHVPRGGGTPPTKIPCRNQFPVAAFTLLELLVVVGLIAALAFVLISGLGGGGKSAALQSAQATLANMITVARVKAMASGQPARVLVHIDPNSTAQPNRYLRYVALQVQVAGTWQLVTEAYLPDGIYLVPGKFSSIPAGLFSTSTSTPWTRSDGSALRSTVLRNDWITTETIGHAVAEQWASFGISAAGTTAQWGDIILAAGRQRAPGSFAAGESPVELLSPEQVRGLALSSYGVPVLVNSRASF